MDIQTLILKRLAQKKSIKASDIVEETGFSRAYINRFFKKLSEEGRIVLLGKANRANYVLAKQRALNRMRKSVLNIKKTLVNKNLSEEDVLDGLKKETGIFLGLPRNVAVILDYAFTEMLNNAIEHSRSKKIAISFARTKSGTSFKVLDRGVGIFKNIIKKRKLKNELEAIQDLIKGKQTTLPREHTGEGVFFTSKVADLLVIHGSNKKLIFNNFIDDIFIKDAKPIIGTRVSFTINIHSKRELIKVFRAYSGKAFDFSKTRVVVKLFEVDTNYISRSQARRVMSGLENFQTIILDFKGVETMGQAFADEVFRVWQSHHPDKEIQYLHANENIEFMIRHALVQ